MPFSDLTFDQALIEQGLTLTAIGMGTAFALLIILSVGIWVVGKFFRPKEESPDEMAQASAAGREKALAAAIAVSALLEIRDNSATLTTTSPGT